MHAFGCRLPWNRMRGTMQWLPVSSDRRPRSRQQLDYRCGVESECATCCHFYHRTSLGAQVLRLVCISSSVCCIVLGNQQAATNE